MNINLKKADLMNLPQEDLQALYIACESFARGKGFEVFFDHITNLYISSQLGNNELRRANGVIPISDEFFSGGVQMLGFLHDQIVEYSKASNLRPVEVVLPDPKK